MLFLLENEHSSKSQKPSFFPTKTAAFHRPGRRFCDHHIRRIPGMVCKQVGSDCLNHPYTVIKKKYTIWLFNIAMENPL